MDHRNRSGSSSPRRKRSRSPSSPRRRSKGSGRSSLRDPSPEPQYEYGKPADIEEKAEKKPKVDKEKPNFSLSGKLSEEQRTTANGTVLKFVEPADAAKPTKKWRLYPFKGSEALEPISINHQSVFVMGRDRSVVDVPLDHPSCSKQHAVIQFRKVTKEDEDTGEKRSIIKPYLMDLESANGSFLNGDKIEDRRYYELKEKDVLKFGFSTREYVVLHEDLA